ncbi:hypothetical protein [Rhodanobacter denitrificans]|uniref:hypothetical protein n=1 Tax=Rhodanobacter denitrificans TaxID=666685 RepID=UPI001F3B3BAB|nr:hypothetical protein [Rhodanobacter denitrificans]UJJ60611.1 hypothetical protein LRK55_19445 [Rhodanobacter denitrificans]
MLDPSTEGVVRRLRKILALAERGEAGERENARTHLDKLLRHHGLSMDDITADDGGSVGLCKFEVTGSLDARLLRQVVAMVANTSDVRQYRRGRSRKHVAFMLTRSQYAQATFAFAVIRTAWERELEVTFKAFVQVNGLFASEAPPSQLPELTPEREAELAQMLARMNAMQKTPIRKALPAT